MPVEKGKNDNEKTKKVDVFFETLSSERLEPRRCLPKRLNSKASRLKSGFFVFFNA